MSAISGVSQFSNSFSLQELTGNISTTTTSNGPNGSSQTTSQLSFTQLLLTLQASQTQSTSATSAASSAGGTSNLLGALGSFFNSQQGPGDSATISGNGQLVHELQQLQTQNPTEFTQFATQAASQLQSAASQATQDGQTQLGQFLTNLSNKFTQLANGADVSQVFTGHHAHQSQSIYNQNGQVSQASSVNPLAGANSGGVNIQQLFSNLSSELSQALSVGATASA